MTRNGKTIVASLVVASIATITYLHHMTAAHEQRLHSIYNELHYLPLLAAALLFGVRGALLCFLLMSLFYLSYLVLDWSGTLLFLMDNFVHLIFPGVIALVLGFFVDRERKHRQELEKERYLSGLGQAAAAVVHDLKNPIFVIAASLARIRDGRGDLQRSVRVAEEGAKKLERIVQGILDFARPSTTGKLDQDLRKTVCSACDSCREKAEAAGVHILVETSPELMLLSLDVLQIERALVNLLSNAIESSKSGQPVSVSLRRESKNAVIAVSDRGNGMDKETVDHLFVPFYSKKNKGTGLGMVIAKKIIEEHGGRIEVASRQGVGTRVNLLLPLKVNGV
jgi:signal transduction histidine kinase